VLHRLLADDRTRQIPIVIVTGYGSFLPTVDGQRVVRVLPKPLDVDELMLVLRTTIAGDQLP
jgi:hypothetical protein